MYLIIGANGFLGHYMIKNILSYTKDDILAFDLNPPSEETESRLKWIKGDITNPDSIEKLNLRIQKERKCKVIYLAAYHHPDKVEENPKLAWHINITSLSRFLNTMDNIQCLFYASTDTVYGEGDVSFKFKEDSNTNPVNLYGVHKATAECLVNAYGYNVVRYPFLIGPSLVPYKKHFYDVIVDAITNGNTMDMFEDSYRSSLDFNQAAGLLIRLMEQYDSKMSQVINVAGDQCLSKYDVGIRIAEKLSLDSKLINPIQSSDNDKIFIAKRSKTALLDNTLIKEILSIDEIKLKM